MAQETYSSAASPHVPVLLKPILDAIQPVSGRWLDGTFGAGGYTRALLDAGADEVLAVDRDPEVFERAKPWAGEYGSRLKLISGEFAQLDTLAEENGGMELDGVVLDIGVSSMQIDQVERGFSFQTDGPLDMRMSQAGVSAADLVNNLDESDLADILFLYGEERGSRRIARNIIAARADVPILTTGQMVKIIERSLPRPKPNQAHIATRTFQALRIAVNDELGQLVTGLQAAENALKEGGLLAVVTFHSLEDRIVKRFMTSASGGGSRGNRYQPETIEIEPRFERVTRKATTADPDELAINPRSRSAKLRIARRLSAAPLKLETRELGLPQFDLGKLL